jgi:hypothetical protein
MPITLVVSEAQCTLRGGRSKGREAAGLPQHDFSDGFGIGVV